MIQTLNYLLRCKMFFFQIMCEKNTGSFVPQMLAAHNVAIILNILRCLKHNQNFKQHWGKSIFIFFHKRKNLNKQKKNTTKKTPQPWVCHSCFRNCMPSFYQWMIIKTEGRDVMTSSCLFFSFFQNSKFRMIQIVLPLPLSDVCAAKEILYILSLKRIIPIAFYRYFTISVHVANLVWIWIIILLPG